MHAHILQVYKRWQEMVLRKDKNNERSDNKKWNYSRMGRESLTRVRYWVGRNTFLNFYFFSYWIETISEFPIHHCPIFTNRNLHIYIQNLTLEFTSKKRHCLKNKFQYIKKINTAHVFGMQNIWFLYMQNIQKFLLQLHNTYTNYFLYFFENSVVVYRHNILTTSQMYPIAQSYTCALMVEWG